MVGNFVTALNMNGASITLTRLNDESLKYFDTPTLAPAWPVSIQHNPEPLRAVTTFTDTLPEQGPVNQWLTKSVQRIQGATDDLTDLDRKAGDGDLESRKLIIAMPLRV